MNEYQLLEKHTTEETAYLVEDYPYGFRQRTKIRYWIETDKRKGDRFVSQTLNPKTLKWNKPKKSVYNAVMVMYKDLSNNHIKCFGLYPTTSKEKINNFLTKVKGFNFNSEQKEQLRVLNAYSKAYENVEFKFSVRRFRHKLTKEITKSLPIFELNDYEEIDENGEVVKEEEEKKKQEKVKKDINLMVNYYYSKNGSVE